MLEYVFFDQRPWQDFIDYVTRLGVPVETAQDDEEWLVYLPEELVWCFMLIDDSSETLSGQPLGAYRREWHALSKVRNNADDRLGSRPKGSPLRPGYCVAILEKGKPFSAHCALSPGLSGLL